MREQAQPREISSQSHKHTEWQLLETESGQIIFIETFKKSGRECSRVFDTMDQFCKYASDSFNHFDVDLTDTERAFFEAANISRGRNSQGVHHFFYDPLFNLT